MEPTFVTLKVKVKFPNGNTAEFEWSCTDCMFGGLPEAVVELELKTRKGCEENVQCKSVVDINPYASFSKTTFAKCP